MSRISGMSFDEAVEEMSKAALQKALDLQVAEREVYPIVGEVYNLKSAEDVYRYCLTECGIDLDGIAPSAFRGMVRLLDGNGKLKRPEDAGSNGITGMDGAPATDRVSRAIARIKFA